MTVEITVKPTDGADLFAIELPFRPVIGDGLDAGERGWFVVEKCRWSRPYGVWRLVVEARRIDDLAADSGVSG